MRVILILSGLCWISSVQSQNQCGAGKECVDAGKCDFYNEERGKLKDLRRGSSQYNNVLSKLKSLVCNKADRKVCCAVPDAPADSPRYRPSYEDEECGSGGSHAGFIRGGEDTRISEFPFLALLGKTRRSGRGVFWHCGGTLINKWYVLTAAHCGPQVEYVRLGEWEVVDPDNVTISENSATCYYYNEKSERKCRASSNCDNCRMKDPTIDCDINKRNDYEVCSNAHQDIDVAEVKTHPEYGKTAIGLAINDIMLLKLSRPAEYNEFVKPVCLPLNKLGKYGEPDSRIFDNNRAMVVGWGRTGTQSDNEIRIVSQAKQQKLEVPAVSNRDCIRQYNETLGVDLTGNIKPDLHLCAGGEEGKDSCKGDSGGPLMAREDDLAPWQIVGVVSGGTKRCGIGAPGIFTRVTEFDQWIRDNLV